MAVDVQEIIQYQRRYGLRLTPEQVGEILESDDELVKCIEKFGADTGSMEWFANATGRWLGLEGKWPLNQDPEVYSRTYFSLFVEAAKKKGLELSETFMEKV